MDSSSQIPVPRLSPRIYPRYSWPRRILHLVFYLFHYSLSPRLGKYGALFLLVFLHFILLGIAWANTQWLKDNSAFVNVVMTYLLLAVTGTYVYLTWKIVTLQRDTEHQKAMPLLHAEIHRTDIPEYVLPVDQGDGRLRFALIMKNIGATPAMDIHVRFHGTLLTGDGLEPFSSTLGTAAIIEPQDSIRYIIDLTEALDAFAHIPSRSKIRSFLQLEYIFHDAHLGFHLYSRDYSFFKATMLQYQQLDLQHEAYWFIPQREARATTGDGLWYLAHGRRPDYVRGEEQAPIERIRSIMDWRFRY